MVGRANCNGFKITTSRTDWRDEMGVRPVGVTLGSLSKYFPQQQIEAILHASGREGTRRRKLPTLELMYYVIALGLHASEAWRSVLRRIMVRKRLADEDDFGAGGSGSALH